MVVFNDDGLSSTTVAIPGLSLFLDLLKIHTEICMVVTKRPDVVRQKFEFEGFNLYST